MSCARVIFERVQPYSLRHTAARWMRLHGVSVDEVAQQLGHKNLGVTGVYTEYHPQYLKSTCEALDGLTCQILVMNSRRLMQSPQSQRRE